jgi:hypothetical protein
VDQGRNEPSTLADVRGRVWCDSVVETGDRPRLRFQKDRGATKRKRCIKGDEIEQRN